MIEKEVLQGVAMVMIAELNRVEAFARSMQGNAQAEVNRLEAFIYNNRNLESARRMRDEAIVSAAAYKNMGDYCAAEIKRINKEVGS